MAENLQRDCSVRILRIPPQCPQSWNESAQALERGKNVVDLDSISWGVSHDCQHTAAAPFGLSVCVCPREWPAT